MREVSLAKVELVEVAFTFHVPVPEGGGDWDQVNVRAGLHRGRLYLSFGIGGASGDRETLPASLVDGIKAAIDYGWTPRFGIEARMVNLADGRVPLSRWRPGKSDDAVPVCQPPRAWRPPHRDDRFQTFFQWTPRVPPGYVIRPSIVTSAVSSPVRISVIVPDDRTSPPSVGS